MKGRHLFKVLLKLVVVSVLSGIFGLIALAVYLMVSTPDVSYLKTSFPEMTAFIEREKAAGQRVLWHPVPYEKISLDLKKAVLISEDINFFSHNGFEIHEIRQALSARLHGKKLRGASTLTQQLAKNLWLSSERSIWRKLREAALCSKLERELSKKRILELYLNCVEFGPGVFGAEAASMYYFKVPASRLGPRQAARLAVSLPSPSRRHPGIERPAIEEIVARLLFRMKKAEWLDQLL